MRLGGQDYLRVELRGEADARLARELGSLATVSAWFAYREALGGEPGPWLRPVETGFQPFLPPDLVTARRYRGKTNELFTQFLCNVARHASDFSEQPWTDLRVVDPLAGGGTTLLVALSLGADVAGVEKSPQDVESTAAFLRAYTREKGIPCKVQEERLRGVGRRWWFRVGRAPQGQCILALGETARAEDLLRGVRPPHLIVTDLPYGISTTGRSWRSSTGRSRVGGVAPARGALAFLGRDALSPGEEMLASGARGKARRTARSALRRPGPPGGPGHPPPRRPGGPAGRLDVKADVQDVAVLDDVLFALEAQPPQAARPGHRLRGVMSA